MKKEEILSRIEIDDEPNFGSSGGFFIDLASPSSLKQLLLLFIFFILVHAIAAFYAPKYELKQSRFYPIEYNSATNFLKVDLTLSNLSPGNRLVTVDCEISRKNTNELNEMELNITLTENFNKNFNFIRINQPKNIFPVVRFMNNDQLSSPFQVFNQTVTDFDQVQIRFEVQSSFDNVDGINFNWTSTNPNSYRFIGFCKLSSCFFVIYLFVFFIPFSQFDIEPFTQKLIVFYLSAAFFVTLPISTLLNNDNLMIFDIIIFSIFLSSFKLFLVLQDTIAQNDGEIHLSNSKVIMAIFLFVLCAIIDIIAKGSRDKLQKSPFYLQEQFTFSEMLNIGINFLTSILFILYGIMLLKKSMYIRRSVLSSIALFISSILTLSVEVVIPIFHINVKYICPQMIFISFHIVISLFVAFLFHQADDIQYQML